MPKLKFFDVKGKKTFMTDKFKVIMKNGRRMAIAKAPSGAKAVRFLAKK
jgi:hypothetical protein